jgi:adenosine deaminase
VAVGVGPSNIRIALDDLRAERIDHGIAITEDAALLRRVADARIPITVCPNSNILIANRYPTLADHPFRAMRQAGLFATINTDDPAMTDLDLGREYRSVATALHMPFDEMAAAALDGIEASWLDASEARALQADFERDIAALRSEVDGNPSSAGVNASSRKADGRSGS